jgi:hypothetical protein
VARPIVKIIGLGIILTFATTTLGVNSLGASSPSPGSLTALSDEADGTVPPAAGSGYLSIFQEASSTPLDVSIDGGAPVRLLSDTFSSALIPAGSHTITVMSGTAPFASGIVAVPAGQHVTVLVYISPSGTPVITAFSNNEVVPPVGQSRVVFRNTANASPVDVYLNGVQVASALADDPISASSVSVLVNAGPVNVAVTDAGAPLSEALVSEQGVLVAGDLLNEFIVGNNATSPSTVQVISNAIPLEAGYRLFASDGGVFNFGDSSFFGSTGGSRLNEPVVGAAPTSVGVGYWLVASDGGVFSFGDATFYGSMGGTKLNEPVVGMAAMPDEGGYWLVASDGGIFSFGDATFYGSMGGTTLNEPVVGMAATTDGRGYWLVSSDGGVFSFGDAGFYGSAGDLTLNKPIVSIVPTVDGRGYWLVASDGGVFAYGDATFEGSAGSLTLNEPIVAAISTPDSLGYWLIASDGGVFDFGDAAFYGSTGNVKLNRPIVAASAPAALLPN